MKKLAAALATLVVALGVLVATAGSASASSYTWQYQFGNVGGQLIHGDPSSDRNPSWVEETYSYPSTGGCYRSQLRFQSDGNLVLYYAHSDVGSCGPWAVWWASNTNGNPHSILHFQVDGTISITRQNGTVAWSIPRGKGTNYRYLVKLGFGCWEGYYTQVQGGPWSWLWGPGGSGSGC